MDTTLLYFFYSDYRWLMITHAEFKRIKRGYHLLQIAKKTGCFTAYSNKKRIFVAQ